MNTDKVEELLRLLSEAPASEMILGCNPKGLEANYNIAFVAAKAAPQIRGLLEFYLNRSKTARAIQEKRRRVEIRMRTLNPREVIALKMRNEKAKYKDIANALGVSVGRATQIVSGAARKQEWLDEGNKI